MERSPALLELVGNPPAVAIARYIISSVILNNRISSMKRSSKLQITKKET